MWTDRRDDIFSLTINQFVTSNRRLEIVLIVSFEPEQMERRRSLDKEQSDFGLLVGQRLASRKWPNSGLTPPSGQWSAECDARVRQLWALECSSGN